MTVATRTDFKLARTQAAFALDEHRYCGFVGGIGSGKSYAGAAKALLQHLDKPSLGLVTAPTYPMLRDATWRTALEVWARLIRSVNRNEMLMTMRTGAEVIFRSTDDPERLRGPNCSWGWMDEGSLSSRDAFPIIIGRLRQDGEPGPCWVTFTPKGFDNWTYETFALGAGDADTTSGHPYLLKADTALYRASTYMNPFLSPEFESGLRAQYGTEYSRQELGGEFVALGAGLIKRQWFRIADHAPDGLKWARYWDLAASEKTSADYTCSFRMAFDSDQRLYIADGIRDRWAWPDARRVILQAMTAEEGVEVGIETAGMQLALWQDIMRQPETRARRVREVHVDRDKVSRAQPWIARAEAGLVTLVRGPWVTAFLNEAENFPTGEHDDQIDAVSGGVQMLARVKKGIQSL